MTFPSWEENVFCILMEREKKKHKKQASNVKGKAKASFVCRQILILMYILIQYIFYDLIIFKKPGSFSSIHI